MSKIKVFETQRVHIVIDDIIFVKGVMNSSATKKLITSSAGNTIVIDDIIFLRMKEDDTLILGTGITALTSPAGIEFTFDNPSPGTGDPTKLTIIDPNESVLEMDMETLTVRSWKDDDGVSRQIISSYKLTDLDYLEVTRDTASDKLILKLYWL